MKFGKEENIDHIDFTLPVDHPLTQKTLSKDQSANIPDVFIGSAKWGVPELKGKIFPPKTPQKDFLHHYSRHFTSVEMNTTHYRIPKPEWIEKWKQETPEGFRFCPKVPQIISHRKDFGEGTGADEDFIKILPEFGEKLGPTFLQLPAYFDTSRKAMLEKFIDKWPEDLPLAVEIRHESWFQNQEVFNKTADFMQSKNIGTVITDTSGRRDVIHQCMTNKHAFIRFTGNGLHPTDYSRIDNWVQRLTEWSGKGLQSIYFFVHQPREDLCVDLAVDFGQKLEKALGTSLHKPSPLF